MEIEIAEANEIAVFSEISRYLGEKPDIIQGGGGNTSIKIDDNLMAVKASGCMLKDVNPLNGYVVINYRGTRDFFNRTGEKSPKFQKECALELSRQVVYPGKQDSDIPLKPSVEAGFHSFLDGFVIHSHSVYANIVACCLEGRSIAEEVCRDEGQFIWIPYINPGAELTLSIKKALAGFDGKESGVKIFFLENHGIIVSADDPWVCRDVHDRLQEKIKKRLGITAGYPQIDVILKDSGGYFSNSSFIKEWKGELNSDLFFNTVLYPDQIVYLNSNIIKGDIVFSEDNSVVGYSVSSLREALAFEETMIAYLYVLYVVKKQKLTLKVLNRDEIDFIADWDEEEYRKKVMRKNNF